MHCETRRISDRDPCEIVARLRSIGGTQSFACVIRDLSEQGARLEVGDSAMVPAQFELLIPIIGDIVDERQAEVRWRRHRDVGVLFLSSPITAQRHDECASTPIA